LERYIRDEGVDAIVPSEPFLLAAKVIYPALRHLITAGPDALSLYRAFSKCDVHSALSDPSVSAHLPPTLVWRRGDALPTATELEHLGTPLFIKGDACYATAGSGSMIARAGTVDEGLSAVKRLSESYSALLIQGFVPGFRVVADFCIWKGAVRSRSMMIARHENPHHGGMSTLRAVGWDQEIWDDAEKKLRRLGIEGVAMMEYRRDSRSGLFHFIEVNARYWTGLHVEIGSEIDIPRLHLDAFFGVDSPVPPVPLRRPLFRYVVPGEVGYVASLLKDRSATITRKAWVVVEFLLLGLNPAIKADLSFPGDRGLYFLAWVRFLRPMLRR